MVKERVLVDTNQFNNYELANDDLENGDNDSVDSGSSEELHYGPGIVNKLKNRYISLTLRESNVKARPSILSMRKATSLEHLLDDDIPNGIPATNANSRIFQSRWRDAARNASNKYNGTRSDLKRARSVETISRNCDQQNDTVVNEVRLKHESLHEDMLIIKEGNDIYSGKMFDNTALEITERKPFSNAVPHVVNRPKRITPIMSEKEKPPADLVKQTKMIFEGRAEQRTKTPQQTGEVAAKVATYKSIIGQVANKKPPILKQKPVISQENNKKVISSNERSKLQKPCKLPLVTKENGWINQEKSPSPDIAVIPSVVSPIPDISRTNSTNGKELGNTHKSKAGPSLSETPDLILHSSPTKNVLSTFFKVLATSNFLKAEIAHTNNTHTPVDNKIQHGNDVKSKVPSPTEEEKNTCKLLSPESRNNIRQAGNSITYNLSSSSDIRSHLPIILQEKRVEPKNTPSLPVKNAQTNKISDKITPNTPKLSLPSTSNLTPREIEKNNINRAKSLEQTVILSTPLSVKCGGEVKRVEVPKTTLPKKSREQNSIVFKFTDRKDVPDYVGNDGTIRTGKIEKPKVGEGGIILLPGASLDESVTDDDDDWMLSLEGPPSPCDVTFINDNVLIDGRSSLNQKNKKNKMKIQFVETIPEIFEYPSESSFLDELQPLSRDSSPGHVVPTLSGSSLANYIPKSGSSEDFQLGITRAPIASPVIEAKNDIAYQEPTELEEPVLFSAGTNSDILF